MKSIIRMLVYILNLHVIMPIIRMLVYILNPYIIIIMPIVIVMKKQTINQKEYYKR